MYIAGNIKGILTKLFRDRYGLKTVGISVGYPHYFRSSGIFLFFLWPHENEYFAHSSLLGDIFRVISLTGIYCMHVVCEITKESNWVKLTNDINGIIKFIFIVLLI